jgi:uncharacterized protein YecE (DUF72 family)
LHASPVWTLTASFVYARIMGTSEKQAQGYSKKALDGWADRARQLAAAAMALLDRQGDSRPR